MPYTTYTVSHSKKDNFQLHIVEKSRFRETVADVLDTILCRWPGANHLFGWQFSLCNKLYNWAYQKETRLADISITDEVARKISPPDSWDWLDTAQKLD